MTYLIGGPTTCQDLGVEYSLPMPAKIFKNTSTRYKSRAHTYVGAGVQRLKVGWEIHAL